MGKADNSSLVVRLDSDLKAKLETLARKTNRPKSHLAAEAIAAYIASSEHQIAEIEAGIAELDSGDVIAESDADARYERLLSSG